jgi:putative peptidoglycan lipid II flippase
VKIGMAAVALNFALNISLVWWLAELGLAVATAVSASVQVVALTVIFSRRLGPLDWRPLVRSIAGTLVATALMTVVVVAILWAMPTGAGRGQELLRVTAAVAGGIVSFLAMSATLGMSELAVLLGLKARANESAPRP